MSGPLRRSRGSRLGRAICAPAKFSDDINLETRGLEYPGQLIAGMPVWFKPWVRSFEYGANVFFVVPSHKLSDREIDIVRYIGCRTKICADDARVCLISHRSNKGNPALK